MEGVNLIFAYPSGGEATALSDSGGENNRVVRARSGYFPLTPRQRNSDMCLFMATYLSASESDIIIMVWAAAASSGWLCLR